MKVAVEGCCHGELDKIYETLQHLERVNNVKVDLLLICGDFQAVRNRDDLKAMAVPQKYQKLNTFYKYYSGEKVAPVLTIFIGGNHEASNYMQELPYGGWVAKNIYYMGYANVIEIGGLRIGGLSGIYKDRDYHRGHYEYPPYSEDTKRSVYHIRSIEVFRLKQLKRPLDIFMSHDWPQDIARYGNMQYLFAKKPFLRSEVMDGSLGSPPAAQLLHALQPRFWFAAHLHVKYMARVQHPNGSNTKFLSLDKCLPRRQFLQVLDFPDKGTEGLTLNLDPEWLCVLQNTNHLMHLGRTPRYMPGPQSAERSNFEVSDEDIANMRGEFRGSMKVLDNFEPTAPTLLERQRNTPPSAPVLVNPQTALLCTVLDLTDPNAVHLGIKNHHSLAHKLDTRQMALLDQSDDDSDDKDSGNDDAPTDVSSGCLSSSFNSLDRSTSSFCSPARGKSMLSPMSVSAGKTVAPSLEVADDDEEFKTILAAQRRQSQQMSTRASANGASPPQASASPNPALKPSLSSSPKEGSLEDELASIMVAAKQRLLNSDKSASSSEEGGARCGYKSSSDIDSTSQDSQDECDRPMASHDDSSQASITGCMEVSVEGESSQTPMRLSGKHPSPNNISAESPTVKKLKRRNVSMYSSSGTEEDPC